MPRYSVLLPTRNRLEYLRGAVESVRRQDYDDYEIIISDNASEQPIEEFVQSLGDPRVRYLRSDEFLPVTKNWNRALDASTGEYVIMLGDDDGLMAGYFARMDALIERFDSPELIHTNGYLYAWPGAVQGSPAGYTATWTYDLFHRRDPYVLDREVARRIVALTFDFVVGFGWNMQLSLVRRSLVDEMKRHGDFYQSPYPDYYATNALVMKSKRTVVCPDPVITVGITPASFGSYYFGGKEKAGVAFLNNVMPEEKQRLSSVVLPGEEHNTSWLLSLEVLKRSLPEEMEPFRISYQRYRWLQLWRFHLEDFLGEGREPDERAALAASLGPAEKLVSAIMRAVLLALRLRGKRMTSRFPGRIHAWFGQYPAKTLRMLRTEDNDQDFLSFYEREAAERPAS